MSQPPPFPSGFGGPPPPRCFPPVGPPPPGPFRGGPPPPSQAFFPSPFPPGGRSSGGAGPPGPSLGYPPLHPPFPPCPPWQRLPEWRPEAVSPGEKPRFPLGPEAALLPPGGSAREEAGGGGEEEAERWLSRFLARPRAQAPAATPGGPSPTEARRVATEALRRVAEVAALCRAWRRRSEAGEEGEAEEEEKAAAERRLAELRELVRPLREPGCLAALRRKAEKSRKKRLRRKRGRQECRAAREEAAARAAEREALIDRWRARRAQEVEEKHREQELKAAADSVLSEVRKKQADTKRVAEILRGLEKLRKLRKEAAGRKGVCPPPEADEAFENEIQSLRELIKQRTEVYEAEERALRVMLEGEQEEERKREMEKKQKKEKEKLLQQKREMDCKLFGDPEEFPRYHLLEPFRQYYLQAEYSVPALIQIRHEWDRFLVPADHPEGSFIPPGWVLPSLPSSDIWGTAVG
ncbi:programmed cell death protein 7 [Eublepharis macularius]|uniref:Programmed cell death protein 7 n=1 Tax=Eublepharis macularius TaxID=481883 RepID=A0AA97KLA5_EUBMA|nr:programmed cell death protein 7 [Eublepharis macularius]